MNNIEQQHHHPTNTHLCKVKILRGGNFFFHSVDSYERST